MRSSFPTENARNVWNQRFHTILPARAQGRSRWNDQLDRGKYNRHRGVGMSPRPQEGVYRARPIKSRRRSTASEVEDRRGHLIAILNEMNPMSVRQVYY